MENGGHLRPLMRAKRFESFPDVARAMRAGWALSNRPAYSEANLKNRLTSLNNGEVKWWKKETVAAARLAAILETSVARLRAIAHARDFGDTYSLTEWPDLRHIDLARSDFVHDLGWVVGRGHQRVNLYGRLDAGPAAWVTLPPGAGRTLVVALHHARRGRGEAISAVSGVDLSEAVRQRKSLSDSEVLVVELKDFDASRDAGAAIDAARLRGLWVLSHSPAPRCPTGASAFREYTWDRPESWLPSLVRWIGSRAEEAHSWSGFLKMLEDIDARRSLPFTTRDILHLAKAWAEGARDGNVCLDRAARAIVRQGAAADRLEPAERVWADACSWHAMEHALASRWERCHWPWEGPLRADQWAELLPSRLASTLRDRRDTSRIEASETMAVWLLRRLGLLVPAEGNTLRCASVVVEEAIGRREAARDLARAVHGNDLAEVGLRGLGKARRPLLDAAFAELEQRDLVSLARHSARPSTAKSDDHALGLRALSDATFVAVGLWLGSKGSRVRSEDRTALSRFFVKSWSNRLHFTGWRHPSLATRPADGDGEETGLPDEGNAFLAACWGWSFALDRPETDFASSDAWLFPGWFDAVPSWGRIAEPAGWHSASANGRDARWPAFDWIVSQLDHVTPKLRAEFSLAGSVFRGPLLLRCAIRDDPFPFRPQFPSLAAFGWSGRWTEEFLARIENSAHDDHPRIAAYFLAHATNEAGCNEPPLLSRLNSLRRFGLFGEWVRDHLRPDALASFRRLAGLKVSLGDDEMVDLLQWLRTEQAETLLDWLAEDAGDKDNIGMVLLAFPDRWRNITLLEHAARLFPTQSAGAYRRLWELDAETTATLGKRLLASSAPGDLERAYRLLANVPWEHADAAASLLASIPESSRPDWTSAWAHRVLTRGDVDPIAAWRLLREASSR